jgi:adhesin/invasin
MGGNGAPLANRIVQLTASGANNTIVQPAVTNASGVATGTISSTRAETKTITATIDPGADAVVIAQQPTVEFVADQENISAVLSTASASPATGVIADGTSISTITVTVVDVNGNGIAAQVVQLAATGSNNTLVQPAVTNALGVATGTIASTTAEIKTITATINTGADQNGNPVAGQTVQLTSTGSSNTLVQPGLTNASGVATGTIASTTAETKTITATVNPGASQVVIAQQPTVQFVGDPSTINALQSTATASPTLGVIADGSTISTITVTVRDVNGNTDSGQVVDLS